MPDTCAMDGITGLFVFADEEAAMRWLTGGEPFDWLSRGFGCPECLEVHFAAGDAFGCCSTGRAVPVQDGGGWEPAAVDRMLAVVKSGNE